MTTQTTTITTTVVPLDWKRYKERLRGNGWHNGKPFTWAIDFIADEMFDQYAEIHGMSIEDDHEAWDRIFDLAREAAFELT